MPVTRSLGAEKTWSPSSRAAMVAAIVLGLAVSALAELWYEPYERGKKEAESGPRANWAFVEEQMLAAKRLGPKQGRSVLYYGTIRRPYIPDYYLAIASYELGRTAQAGELLAAVRAADLLRPTDREWNEFTRYSQLVQRVASGPTPAPPTPLPVVSPSAATPTAPPPSPGRSPTTAPPSTLPATPLPAAVDVARVMTEARSQLADKRFTQARERAELARTGGANSRDVAALVRAIDVAEGLEGLRRAVSASRWLEARTYVDRVGQLDPSNADLGPLKLRVDEALRPQPSPGPRDGPRNALRDALRTYYSGNYEDALHRFEDIARTQPDVARAHFYAACSQVALALTVPGDPSERFSKAREAFARVRGGMASLSPDRRFVSPRIIEILEGRAAPSPRS